MKIQASLRPDKNNGYFTWRHRAYTFFIISRSFLPGKRNISDEIFGGKLKHKFYIQKHFFNRAVCEIMWKLYCTFGQATDHKYSACALHGGHLILQTHTQNVQYLTAFPQQQWLHERASVLRYTYIACLLNNKLSTRGSNPYDVPCRSLYIPVYGTVIPRWLQNVFLPMSCVIFFATNSTDIRRPYFSLYFKYQTVGIEVMTNRRHVFFFLNDFFHFQNGMQVFGHDFRLLHVRQEMRTLKRDKVATQIYKGHISSLLLVSYADSMDHISYWEADSLSGDECMPNVYETRGWVSFSIC